MAASGQSVWARPSDVGNRHARFQKMTPGVHLGLKRRELIFLRFLDTSVSFFLCVSVFVALAGATAHGKSDTEVRLAPRHSQLVESCIRHAKIIPTLLTLWSAGLDVLEATWLHPHNFLHREAPVWNASSSSAAARYWKMYQAPRHMRDVKRYETRCNTAKSINFQLSRTPPSSVILFGV